MTFFKATILLRHFNSFFVLWPKYGKAGKNLLFSRVFAKVNVYGLTALRNKLPEFPLAPKDEEKVNTQREQEAKFGRGL
jgi:hypothetical protein